MEVGGDTFMNCVCEARMCGVEEPTGPKGNFSRRIQMAGGSIPFEQDGERQFLCIRNIMRLPDEVGPAYFLN